jgi:CCR4-NOT transcriptional regulation complex NOT5 subunit
MMNIRQLELNGAFIKRAPEKVLFYIFYNMILDEKQVESAKELESRGWKYAPKEMRWFRDGGSAK